MSYEVIAVFENENHSYEVHKHDSLLGDSSYYVVRDDGEQHGAYHDEDRAMQVAEGWAGPAGQRVS